MTSPSVAAWKRMSLEEKYELFEALQTSLYELKLAGVRARHPDWSNKEVESEVARLYIYARQT